MLFFSKYYKCLYFLDRELGFKSWDCMMLQVGNTEDVKCLIFQTVIKRSNIAWNGKSGK